MRTVACAAALAVALVGSVEGFQSTSLPSARTSQLVVNGYVPDGFTAESYKKFKEEEAKKAAQKNLGRLGPRGFQSRSMQSFQEALERGEAEHLLPVFNAKEKLRSGKIKMEDIPYSKSCYRFFVWLLLSRVIINSPSRLFLRQQCNVVEAGITPT
jgi:hypothetical protein